MPRYLVTAKPGSSQEKVVESGAALNADAQTATEPVPGNLTVYLRAKPHDGEANAALVKLLAKHFKVPKTTIKILRGAKSRTKLIEF